MPFWKWSKTPDTNGSIDPTVNWAEGMAPSSVNDSARAMMARLAEYRDDVCNSGTTGGSGTAYTLSSSQVFPSTISTQSMIAFIAHAYNGFNATLSIDGGTPYPLWQTNNIAAVPGTLRPGVLYTASFLNGGWLVHQAQPSYSIPIGGLLDYTSNSLPPGGNFIFPYGQAISRTNYSELYGYIGTTYGAGDGSTTFNVPNLKGRITAALDNLGDGSALGILTSIGGGTILGAQGGAQTHTIAQTNLPSATLTGGALSVSASGVSGGDNGPHYHTGGGTTGGMNAGNPHSHAYDRASAGSGGIWPGGGSGTVVNTSTATAVVDINHGHDYSFTTSPATIAHTHNVTVSGTTSGVSVALGGSNSALNHLPPIMMVTKIMRII